MFEVPKEEIEEEEPIMFHLWDRNLKAYNIFQLLLPFLGDYYSLAPTSALVIELAKENGLKVSETVALVSRVHNGYASTVLKPKLTE